MGVNPQHIHFIIDLFLRLLNQTSPFKCSKNPVAGLIGTDLINLFPALHIYIERHQTNLVDFEFKLYKFRRQTAVLKFVCKIFS